jgi:type I restriction enzyme S subunit
MKIEPTYKKSEVGIIPEDWKVAELNALGRRGRPAIKAGPFGSSLTKSIYTAEGYKVYGQEQVIRGDCLYGDYFISKERFSELKSCAVQPGDILLSLVGTAGRVLVIPQGAPDGIINPRLIRLSFDQDVVSSTFFRFLFESDTYQALLARNAQGGTMGVLSAGLLRPIRIPLPRLSEQIAIADALNDADAFIESLEHLLAKKRHIKHGALQELLTGKKRLPGFSGDWEVKRLGELSALKNGYAFKSGTYTSLGSLKVITIANVQDGYMSADSCNRIASEPIDLQPHQQLNVGDILISMTGNVGRVCRVNEDYCLLNQRVGKLIPTCVDGDFLSVILRQPSFILSMIGVAKGGAQPNLSAADITNHQFSIPKDTAEQAAIAVVLINMDAELAALEQRRDKAYVLKQGMMQELLTGRIRLV